jgi:hypothetical protein
MGGPYSGRGRARAIQAAVAGVWHMNLVPVRFRPHVDGHNTTARVSRGAAGRRRDGRFPRNGLGRADSASRPSMRPNRRTGTATARPSHLRGRGTVGIRSTTVRCKCSRPHARTGVDLRSSLGGDSLLASRSTSCRIRSHVVRTGNSRPAISRNGQHAHWPSPTSISDTIASAARPREVMYDPANRR